MEQNKYIYVGNDQAAGPIHLCHADRNDGECYWKECPQSRDHEPEKSGRSCPNTFIYERNPYYSEDFELYVSSLPRIDIVGKPIFTDGQILEEGKDIEVRPDIYLPESYDEYLEAINEQARELPQRVTYVAIPVNRQPRTLHVEVNSDSLAAAHYEKEIAQLRLENERLTEQLVKVQHDYAEDTRAFGRDAQAREERIKELEAKL